MRVGRQSARRSGTGGADADIPGPGFEAAGGAVGTTGVSTRLGQRPRNRPTAPAATMTATHRDIGGMDLYRTWGSHGRAEHVLSGYAR
jgi:hypothetical protein